MNNEFDYNKTYYKITNKEENHNGFQFKDGLNEDMIPFNTKKCCAGGIYFSDIENMLTYLEYKNIVGCYLREVTVPEDAEVFIEESKYKASKIILGERKELNLDTIKYLIENGANVHVGDESALCWASVNGHLEIVKYLVEQGADIHNENNSALAWASENGHLEVVKYLVEHGADTHTEEDCALRWASENGHLEVVKYLVEHGADIHAAEDLALRWASKHGHLEVVKYFISHGSNSEKALKWAIEYRQIGLVKYLESLK